MEIQDIMVIKYENNKIYRGIKKQKRLHGDINVCKVKNYGYVSDIFEDQLTYNEKDNIIEI